MKDQDEREVEGHPAIQKDIQLLFSSLQEQAGDKCNYRRNAHENGYRKKKRAVCFDACWEATQAKVAKLNVSEYMNVCVRIDRLEA